MYLLILFAFQGWGCAYRTLQSICSWITRNRDLDMDVDDSVPISSTEVPSIEEIQQTLVSIDDKPADFLGSTEWLGALEVSVASPSTFRR